MVQVGTAAEELRRSVEALEATPATRARLQAPPQRAADSARCRGVGLMLLRERCASERRRKAPASLRGLGILVMRRETPADEVKRLRARVAELEKQLAEAHEAGRREGTGHAARTMSGQCLSILGW